MIRTFIDYRIAITGRVWDSFAHIREAQFVSDDDYSRGSIRNLMVHPANPDLNWMNGLKDLPDVRGQMKSYEDYPDRASARSYWESVAGDLSEYASQLTEQLLGENPRDVPGARWKVLLHLVNHGTDHRFTVLQKLHEFGAPTFDQDLTIWLANQ
jgi:uncharacterized damage-inducible protein DinB